MSDSALTTQPKNQRLPALDVLRGIAILGTLLTNITLFTSAHNIEGLAEGVQTGAEFLLNTAIGLFTDGKFIGLLTIMFGIGLEIQRQSALRREVSWLGTYPWRAGLLIVDGLINYLFIFEHDVLMGYGLTALVVAVVMTRSDRWQRLWMWLGIGVHVLHLSYMSWAEIHVAKLGRSAPDWQDTPMSQWSHSEVQALAEELRLPVPELQRQIAQGATPDTLSASLRETFAKSMADASTERYWQMVGFRAENFLEGRAEIPIMMTMGIGLFLVGSQLYRAGIFEVRGARLRKQVMFWAFAVGMPIDWLCRLYLEVWVGSFPRYLTSTFVSFGILALVAHFYAQGRPLGVVGRGISHVGKMALSCYLLQNLIASWLFYGYGLGLADTFATTNQTLVTLGAWAFISGLLMLFSFLWLQKFRRGPAEWLWHTIYEWILTKTGQNRAKVCI